MRARTELLTRSNQQGLDLLDAFRHLKLIELEIDPKDNFTNTSVPWMRAHSALVDALYDVHEREITVSRRPEADPATITKIKDVGEKVLGHIDQVSGYIAFDFQAIQYGRLAIRRTLPRLPFLTSDEPRLNVNFRRHYKVEPFIQSPDLEELRPAVNIFVAES